MVIFTCCLRYTGCVESWSTRVLRVKAVKSSVIVVGGGDSVCWLQVNTSAAILAVMGVYMTALITGLDEKYSVNLAANELGCASASALLM